MLNKFKVGDRVRFVRARKELNLIGNIGTVMEVMNIERVKVLMDDPNLRVKNYHTDQWAAKISSLELVINKLGEPFVI